MRRYSFAWEAGVRQSVRHTTYLLALVVGLLAAPALAQIAEPQRPFGKVVKEWEAVFDRALQEETSFGLSADRADTFLEQLNGIAAEAHSIKEATQKLLAPLEQQLKALGPEPAEGDEPEAPDLAQQRQEIEEDIAFYTARMKQSDLAITRAAELRDQITARIFERSVARLFEEYPLPFTTVTLAPAWTEAVEVLRQIARSPVAWWSELSPERREQIVLYRATLLIVLALAIAWVVRLTLSRWFRRDAGDEDPSYARRLATAIADGLANGILPALVFAGFLIRAYSETATVFGPFYNVFLGFCWGMILLTLSWALPRAVLVPSQPAWRLIPVRPENARRISFRIVLLAVLFSLDVFFSFSAGNFQVSPELFSVYTLLFKGLEALAILALTPAGLWMLADNGAEGTEDQTQRSSRYWSGIRFAVQLIVVVSIVAALTGYANLSTYLTRSLVLSAVAIGVLVLLRGLFREFVGRLLRAPVMQDQLQIPHEKRSRYKFWLRGGLDVLFQVGGLLLVVMIWGVPPEDVIDWVGQILQEITIGEVSISIVDIFVSLIVFIVAMAVTRVLQRLLNDRVFPQTSLDIGVRNSLSSGLGYVGLGIAVALAVSAMGLDLSNIALIAGALSVGIGFGLQNVVNNFVSGLILLVERPIKVGDWILVGGHEGFVKQIKVRATEIETFQRASVIIPNSELVANAVTNWTHKDNFGRVEVAVGVAYGSDVEQVMEVLNTCLKDNKDIMSWPEPFVLFMGFGDSSLDFEARGFIPEIPKVFRVSSDLRVAIYGALEKAGIEIPFPQRDVHIKSMPAGTRIDPQTGGDSSGQ